MKKVVAVVYSVTIITGFSLACKPGKSPCPPGTHCTLDGNYCQVCPNGTFTDQETIATECQHCRVQCGQNEFMKKACSEQHDMVCECVRGYYKEKWPTYGTCLPFYKCPPGYGVKRPGTPWNNTVCEPCEDGKKFSSHESATQICSPCSSCPSGEEVEVKCTASRDTRCQPEGEGLGAGLIVLIVIGCIIAILSLPFVVLLILYRRGKLHVPCLARQGRDKHADEKVNLSHESPRDGALSRTENGTVLNGVRGDYSEELRVSLPPSPGEYSNSRGSTVSPRSLQHQHSSGDANSLSRSRDTIPHSFSNDQGNPQRAGQRHDSGGSGYTIRAFTDLSKDLCSVQWEMLFRRLIGEGSDALINKVKTNYPHNVQEQIYQMLIEWQRSVPDEATLEAIIAELEAMDQNLLASQYKPKLERSERKVVSNDSVNSLV